MTLEATRTRPALDEPLTADEIEAAQRRIADTAVVTPLVPTLDGRTHLKLECLQPYGSYKIRGATNAVRARIEVDGAVETIISASAGNFGQAVAAAAAAYGLRCIIHAPDVAARVKIESLKRLGAEVKEHSFARWWEIMQSRKTGEDGVFIHPVCEREVIAGAATLGEELADDLPGARTIYVPFGGGGLISGIAQAVKARNAGCRVVAVESEVSTPLKAAFEAGKPVIVERGPSFIDGMGSTTVLEEMWPLLQRVVDDVVVVSVQDVSDAVIRLLREHHVVAEGAGAAALAAAAHDPGHSTIAIVSGGNIDWPVLEKIVAFQK
ncbi:MAG TPA: pyridoxal-phosphate dependent enzyme [Caulobacteraceae bacterium]|jgi:threonine dehydratase